MNTFPLLSIARSLNVLPGFCWSVGMSNVNPPFLSVISVVLLVIRLNVNASLKPAGTDAVSNAFAAGPCSALATYVP